MDEVKIIHKRASLYKRQISLLFVRITTKYGVLIEQLCVNYIIWVFGKHVTFNF